MSFEVGKKYTRHQIHAVLGGELQTYLPQSNGRIVCGCFKPSLDPKAPDQVLIGDTPKVKQKAEVLCQQEGTIPVFLKLRRARWEYQGLFCVKKYSVDSEEIQQKQQESGRKGIVAVLYLECASSTLDSTHQTTQFRSLELV